MLLEEEQQAGGWGQPRSAELPDTPTPGQLTCNNSIFERIKRLGYLLCRIITAVDNDTCENEREIAVN